MNNSADSGFANLRQKQADLDTQENLIKKLDSLKSDLKSLFVKSLNSSVKDWKESTDFYLKAKGMIKTGQRYELANIAVYPDFPDSRNGKCSYSFTLKVTYKTNISVTSHTVNTVDYFIEIPAVIGSFVDQYHVPSKLQEDVLTYSEIVKDYKEPAFQFNVTYKSSNVMSSLPLQVASSLTTINETLDAIFGHFFEKFKPQ